jgi:hypothetical protein
MPDCRWAVQVALEVEQQGTSSPAFKTTVSTLGYTASAEAGRKKMSEAKALETLHARLVEAMAQGAVLDASGAGKFAPC